MNVRLDVRGLREAQKKAQQLLEDIRGAPIMNAIRDSVMMVTADAKRNAPVDTGRLRASITPEIRGAFGNIEGSVGSNVVYAPYQELGTKAHFPPPAALETWARRHGFGPGGGFLVARAISRSGIKAKRFIQRAVEANMSRIMARISRAYEEIANK